MYLCYIDESGTADIPGNTSHFVLAGLSIPIWKWKDCDKQIEAIKRRYALVDQEIHVAWILRSYLEQTRVPDFDALDYRQRRSEVERLRKMELLRLQRSPNKNQYRQTKKNYDKTESYIHLSLTERQALIRDVSRCISQWGFARLFAECVDKVHFDPAKNMRTLDVQSFEQIVSRFEQFLQNIGRSGTGPTYGLLIHDNNPTVAKRHTQMMKVFHQRGTSWTNVDNIIETPLFVDSQLTSMVQVADVCAYALRRYLENNEEDLFDLIFQRADRKDDKVVGIRHFTRPGCACKICAAHRRLVGL